MIDAIAYVLLVLTVAAGGVYDARTGKVPNALNYPAILTGLVYWAGVSLWSDQPGIGPSAAGLAAGLAPFAVIYALGGRGGGDVKLMAAVGALSASWRVVLGATVYAMVLALVFAVVIMIRNRATRRTLRNLSRLGRRSRGDADTDAHTDLREDSPRVPFAVAVAFGAALAGAEVMLGLSTPWSAFGP